MSPIGSLVRRLNAFDGEALATMSHSWLYRHAASLAAAGCIAAAAVAGTMLYLAIAV
jgi:hypothetical protein